MEVSLGQLAAGVDEIYDDVMQPHDLGDQTSEGGITGLGSMRAYLEQEKSIIRKSTEAVLTEGQNLDRLRASRGVRNSLNIGQNSAEVKFKQKLLSKVTVLLEKYPGMAIQLQSPEFDLGAPSQEAVRQLGERINQCTAENNNLHDQLEQLRVEKEGLEPLRGQLSDVRAELQNVRKEARTAKEEASVRYDSLKMKLDVTVEESKLAKTSNDQLRLELETSKNQLTTQQGEILALRREVQRLTDVNDDLNNEQRQNQTQMRIDSVQLRNAGARAARLLKEKVDAETRHEAVRVDLERCQNLCHIQKIQIDELNDQKKGFSMTKAELQLVKGHNVALSITKTQQTDLIRFIAYGSEATDVDFRKLLAGYNISLDSPDIEVVPTDSVQAMAPMYGFCEDEILSLECPIKNGLQLLVAAHADLWRPQLSLIQKSELLLKECTATVRRRALEILLGFVRASFESIEAMEDDISSAKALDLLRGIELLSLWIERESAASAQIRKMLDFISVELNTRDFVGRGLCSMLRSRMNGDISLDLPSSIRDLTVSGNDRIAKSGCDFVRHRDGLILLASCGSTIFVPSHKIQKVYAEDSPSLHLLFTDVAQLGSFQTDDFNLLKPEDFCGLSRFLSSAIQS